MIVLAIIIRAFERLHVAYRSGGSRLLAHSDAADEDYD